MAVEQRSLRIEVRADSENEFALIGRAVQYGTISSNELCRGVRERVIAGAFTESLRSGQNVVCKFNHLNSVVPLGTTAAGTLKLYDTGKDLQIRCLLDDSIQAHRDIYASVQRGDISEMSFAFIAEQEDVTEETFNGETCMVRNVRKARLLDVSPVTEPFYGKGATAVAARNQQPADDELMKRACAVVDRIFAEDPVAAAKAMLKA